MSVASVSWIALEPSPLFVFARPDRPSLRLEVATASAPADAGSVRVAVTVRNVGEKPAEGRIWWQLAPVGRRGAWERRVYESALRTVDLRPGDEAVLEWDEAPAVPGDRYEVAVWAHAKQGDSFEPADGKRAEPPLIDVRPASTPLLRHGPPRTGVEIVRVSPAAGGSPTNAGTEAQLSNRTGEVRQALVRWDVVAPPPSPVAYWWRQPERAGGGAQTVVLAPGPDAVVHLDHGRLPPGTYSVRVSLEVLGDLSRESDPGLWPDDDVLLLSGLQVTTAP